VSKFKQKSPVVEAVMWDGKDEKAVNAIVPKGYPPPLFTKDGNVDIWTASGILRARVGDFVVVDGADVLAVRFEAFVGGYEVIPETDKRGIKDFKDAQERKMALEKERGVGHG
jgi:hypothetical protein